MTSLFTPITFRGLTLKNRIGVSPMCQYSSDDGFANDWHLQHIGSRAAGGAGLVIMEATGVTPEGRITPGCHGLWKEEHVAPLKRITDFAKSQGAAIGIQIGHAGRKGSCAKPWDGGQQLTIEQGGWETMAPSAIPFNAGERAPREMTLDDIQKLRGDFIHSAQLAVKAGFQVIEIHAAHGYLLHEFLSPLSNKRIDNYGGSEENRFRLVLQIAHDLRAAVGEDIVIGTRLSCSDWAEGGLTPDDCVQLSAQLKVQGVDFIDCSSGAILPGIKIPVAPGYQVPFAEKIRREAQIPTAAVGMITEAKQADEIVRHGHADMVFLARALLHDAYWPLHAARELGIEAAPPKQYGAGFMAPRVVKAKVG